MQLWKCFLVGALVVLGLCSEGTDDVRRMQKERREDHLRILQLITGHSESAIIRNGDPSVSEASGSEGVLSSVD